MTTIICHHCGTTSTGLRDGVPWCLTCRCWLTRCELTGEWVSCAEHERRKAHARNAQLIDETRLGALGALDLTLTLIPHGWRAQVTHLSPGAYWTLDLHPPTGPITVVASLTSPHAGQSEGWHVGIHNRTRAVAFPLYTAGGTRAAYYTRVQDALAAAIHAIGAERNQSG
jgi:hypothetical protein